MTLDNPPVNALKAALLEELEAELLALDEELDARAIVIRGAGERAFVAGADIKEFPALREAAGETGGSARGIQKVGLTIEAMRTPVVAAIHGFCLGGGLELAMACDIRVASEDAQLGQPEIKLGLIPGGGGTQRLPRLVGRGRALYLNLTGDFISGAQAYEWGLLERVTPPGKHLEGALEIARTLAERSPLRDGRREGAGEDDRRAPAGGRARARGRGLLPDAGVRGRRRGRLGVHREARAALDRPLRAVVLRETGGPEQLPLEEV